MAGLEKLTAIMARLRDKETGCPWDLQQDFRSLVPFTLEEVYEVVDAIEREDYAHLCEELGDLLFQVVFYARIGSEKGLFDMSAIIDGVAAKLLVRHPHVFNRADHERPAGMPALHRAWEAQKQQERVQKGQARLLDDVPLALPALQRAHKIQSRLAGAGFDWHEPLAVLAQVRAELDELESAIHSGDVVARADEMGDVLFSCVNLARHLSCNPETVLRAANAKVERRIRWMEQTLASRQQQWSDKSTDELEELWQAAKVALAYLAG